MSNSNTSSLISSIYKSRKTMIELMNKQEYNTEEYSNFGINEVNSMFQNKQLDMLFEKKKKDNVLVYNEKRKVYVRYYLTKSLRPQNVQEIIDDLFHLEQILTSECTLIIIIKEEVNETLNNLVKHIWEQDKIFIVIIGIKRLQYNILEHSLVPSHRIIYDNELKDVKLKFNITDDQQFPEISRFDPVAQVIGIRPGEVCEIIRPSKTAITTHYYRICV